MAQHNDLGKWGEETAISYLKQKGYVTLAHDWRMGHRDIDIIVVTPDGATVVFVEVKTRTSDAITSPEDAVTLNKMRSIGLCANSYVKTNNEQRELRFDIVTIIRRGDGEPTIEHIIDAFNPCLL